MSRNVPDDHNWTTFAVTFLGQLRYIPHDEAPRECASRVGETQADIGAGYRRAEAPFVSAIESTIRTLCSAASLPVVSSEIAYFLGLRAAVLGPFLFELSVRAGPNLHSTIIPFPSLPSERVVEWLLIDWWRDHGARRIAEIRHMDDTLEVE